MTGFSREKYRKLARGFFGRNKNCLRTMAPRVDKALRYSFRDRRARRRIYRKEWIQTINAAVREHNTPYNRFIWALNQSNIILDRKILSNLAINEPFSFKAVLDEVRIQAQLQSKPHPRIINPIEAYAKKLIIDGALKPVQTQVEEPLPYLFGKRQNVEEIKKKYQAQVHN
ncbi:50S ribosomal protein L20 (macronuclear) [Tetrahymena thermophila SB210]|uniref:50S ribosomal protein L20 n=1 Tax=Tetrahymena thermophila (strain SB210) TaxID=312017 RepID=Q235I3_TETTS|nr:50S ribosomal protein L20 [Tetrahymena thermophila SB210]EAR92218.1 50S ribosomal protein L20 [Tetrahymena thermophila SB210]6Z1P_Au Chain Au, 50S ribosomal protein L20 [Tetrahymena thermophila SB210]|eukprot:XP_001012463.1 50S ribosomal protein L20 [Tetrahymena thermophila SB210]